jgi:uncharacterized membrane protein
VTPSETCRVGIRTIQVVFSVVARPRRGFGTAVWTSVRGVIVNPVSVALWGWLSRRVCCLLVGSIPLVPGLVIVMPVLGHAAWHRYRRIVPR